MTHQQKLEAVRKAFALDRPIELVDVLASLYQAPVMVSTAVVMHWDYESNALEGQSKKLISFLYELLK